MHDDILWSYHDHHWWPLGNHYKHQPWTYLSKAPAEKPCKRTGICPWWDIAAHGPAKVDVKPRSRTVTCNATLIVRTLQIISPLACFTSNIHHVTYQLVGAVSVAQALTPHPPSSNRAFLKLAPFRVRCQ